MKKQSFLLSFFLFLAFNLFAQNTERTIMLLNELRVSDTDIYKKNYPRIYNWSMKASASMPVQRAAHVSESGLIYNCTFIKGDKNFGQYVATMNDMNIKIRKELKEVKENSDMTTQAVLRSAWVQVEKLNIKQEAYKLEDYDFRRIEIFTVPSNKIEEFEALVEKRNKVDKAMDLRKYNYIVYKAIYGYPVNTYLVFVPEKSKLDFCKFQDERNAIRKNNKEYVEIEKKRTQLKTTIRIDHLSRIPNQ
jgi:hypothetical protein